MTPWILLLSIIVCFVFSNPLNNMGSNDAFAQLEGVDKYSVVISLESENATLLSNIPSSAPISNIPSPQIFTVSPHSSALILKFDVSQDIENCSAFGFWTDPGAEPAFEHTVVSILPGLVLGDVDVTVVEDSPSIFRVRRNLRAVGVTVDYSISFDYVRCGYKNVSLAYMESSNLLTQYIDDGDFTIRLREMGHRYNSTCMIHAIASESRLRISSPFDRYPLMPPVVTPFPTLSKDNMNDALREKELEELATETELSAVIIALSAGIFFCICSLCVVKRRMDWAYRQGNTFDHDDSMRDVELPSSGVNDNKSGRRSSISGLGAGGETGDETVVWFNPVFSGPSSQET